MENETKIDYIIKNIEKIDKNQTIINSQLVTINSYLKILAREFVKINKEKINYITK
jgi:hypothetical protein|tara:strand:- start:5377 stop:5544 length:168 start_codon:yes stop_codon:yes gene_type:complete